MRTELKRASVNNGALVLYKNSETVYKTSPARVTSKAYYNVILYKYDSDAIGGECGLKTKKEALKAFKRLTEVYK